MDRGFSRCSDFTTRRCLVCHFAAVAADEFKSCVQCIDRPALFHAIIQPAFVRVSGKYRHDSLWRPECGRVTTALRSVVTRPPSDRDSQHAGCLPVTQLVPITLYRGHSRIFIVDLDTKSQHRAQQVSKFDIPADLPGKSQYLCTTRPAASLECRLWPLPSSI